ncbi:MAG: hypothetical protein E6Q88_03385 [Lysobacteraceae bacterium]|nr:MAG: hypothetical protein E6Q88_03385 [Xanthomonadaceae bacterium]
MEISAIQSIKLTLIQITNLSRDALHVYAGMAIFLATAFVLRKKLKSPIPWLVVFASACIMEAIDAVDALRSYGHWWARESAHDIVNTIFWPTVIFVLARWTRVFNR